MSYQDLTNDICRLVNDCNVWSSTIVIPDGDGVLDISSAANGADSSTPVGATNQPSSFPTGRNSHYLYKCFLAQSHYREIVLAATCCQMPKSQM